MSKDATGRLWRRLSLAALGFVLGTSLEAAAAPVPACFGPASQPMVVYDYVSAYFASFFPLDDETCEDIVKGAVAACHNAVSDAEDCQRGLAASVGKISKKACASEGDGKGDCVADYKDLVGEIKEFNAGEAEAAHEECDTDFAGSLFEYCATGLHP